MSRDPALYLGDIVEACRRIERMAMGRSDRNMVAHEYFGLDRTLVLDVVRSKVPELRSAIEPTLPPA